MTDLEKQLQALYDSEESQPFRIAHLVRRLQQALAADWKTVAPEKLTTPQVFVLFNIAQSPGVDQVTLTRLCYIDRSTINNIVKTLVERGYITRRVGEDNKRRSCFTITPAGESLVSRCIEVGPLSHQRIQRRLSPIDQKQLIMLLEKLLEEE